MEPSPLRDRVRFCNNPVCPRCDEHLRPGEVLRKAERDVCPACHEELVVQPAHPRAPRLPASGRASRAQG